MRPTVLLTLAIAAALSGAPSSASAASMPAGPRLAGQSESAPAALTLEPIAVAIAMGAIAALGLFAWFFAGHARRRRVDSGPTGRRHPTPARRTAADEQVTAALHRRTLRQGRVRLKEDPIIASMGVGSRSRAEPGVSRARRSARRSPPA